MRNPELSQKLREVGSPSSCSVLFGVPLSPCALTRGLEIPAEPLEEHESSRWEEAREQKS